MDESNPGWFRRHRRAILAGVVVAAVVAGGLGLASAVRNARMAASRLNSL